MNETLHPFHPSGPSRLWGALFGGLMALTGLGLLARQLGLLSFDANWWALFIAFPGLGILANAYFTYRQSGSRLNYAVVVQGLLALAILSAAVSAFFGVSLGISWGDIWPVFLVLSGLAILSGAFRGGAR